MGQPILHGCNRSPAAFLQTLCHQPQTALASIIGIALTFALIGIFLGSPAPRHIPMVVLTLFAVGSVCAVLAEALHSCVRLAAIGCLSVLNLDALVSVTVASAPKIRHLVGHKSNNTLTQIVWLR